MWSLLPVGEESSLHSRFLQQAVVRMDEEGKRRESLSQQELGELVYWEERLEGGISRNIEEPPFTYQWVLTADASAVALGWILEGKEQLRGARNLSEGERQCSSTMRELLGVELAVAAIAGRARGEKVLVKCDNQGAISILRKGRERRAMMEELERELERTGRKDLVETARRTMEKSVAPSTLKAYKMSDRARRQLAVACGLEEEASLSLCVFVLDAMAKGRSKSSVATAMSAFAVTSGEDPRNSRFGPLLSAAVKTAARTVPSTPHPKATREDTQAILEWGTRDGASIQDLRIAVLSLTSFGALLRGGEAVALKRRDMSVAEREDLSLLV
ncbi:hypothetical protein PMAYCL1PPCAC_32049, partial [Pristionchus mayeri]